MINKCIFIGNLGADPETRVTNDQLTVTNIRVACTEKWKDKQGNPKELTEWVNVAFFGKLGEIAAQYTKKGSKVYVEGKMRTEKYEKNGETRYSTKIIGDTLKLLSPQSEAKPAKVEPKEIADLADDIPF
jgi:single-strand DNA-binding protein